MAANQQPRLQVVLSFASLAACLILCCNAGTVLQTQKDGQSYNVNIGRGDFITTSYNGVLKCNGLVCPKGTDSCSVYETSLNHPTTIETSIKCVDAANKVLDSRNSSKPNDQGLVVNDFSETSLSGGAINCIDCEGATPEEIKQNMQDQFKRDQKQFRREMEELDAQMKKMHEELSKMNGFLW